MEYVFQCSSLLQKLRIRGYIELGTQTAWRIGALRELGDGLLDQLGGARRYRAFLHDQLVAVQIAGDGSGDGFYLAQIGFSGLLLRGADADKQDRGGANGLVNGVAKLESTARQPAGEQIVQFGLTEPRLPGPELCHPS